MYNVTQDYLNAIENGVSNTKIKLRFSLSKSSPVLCTLTDYDIVAGTLKTSAKMNNGKGFSYGGAVCKECNVTLTSFGKVKVANVTQLKSGLCVKITQWVEVDDVLQNKSDLSLNLDGSENVSGRIEIGYFYIFSVGNSDYECVIKLYDSMLAFDVELTEEDLTTIAYSLRTPEYLIGMCITSCSTDVYELGVTPTLYESLLNKELEIKVDTSTTVKSYRALLGYIGLLCGGFVVITRDGLLDLIKLTNTNSISIASDFVFDYNMSDKMSEITELVTSIAGFNKKYSSIVSGDYAGYSISVKENPLLRGIQPSDAVALEDAISFSLYNVYNALKGILYYGGSIQTISRAELDLGDSITFTKQYNRVNIDGSSELDYLTYTNFILCEIDWSYNGFSSYVCDSNTSKSAESASSKVSSTLKSTNDYKMNGLLRYVYPYEFLVESAESFQLADLVFSLGSGIVPMVTITAILEVVSIGEFHFELEYDGLVNFFKPRYTAYNEGFNTYSFSIGFNATESNASHDLIVSLVSDSAVIHGDKSSIMFLVSGSGVTSASGGSMSRVAVSDRMDRLTFDGAYNFAGTITDAVYT